MSLLKHEQVMRLHEAIVSSGLARSRYVLLVGIAEEIVSGLPNAPDPAAQILGDINALNARGRLRDGSVPVARWIENAAVLSGLRVEETIFRDALRELKLKPPAEVASESRDRKGRGAVHGVRIGALVLAVAIVIAIMVAFVMHGDGPARAAPDAGAPLPQDAASVSPRAAQAADPPASSGSASSLDARRPGPRSPGGAPAVSASAVAAAAAAPTILRGTATLQGGLWSLGVAAQDLGKARYVCLDPSPRPADLAGVQPTCSLLTGTATCSRSDDAKQVPIGSSVAWRLPCP
ncbi:MAG: hypothetical protein ABJE95_25480 [Byssovorax sp.]